MQVPYSTIVLVEDHPIFAACIAEGIAASTDLRLLTVATTLAEARALLDGPVPDALLVDLRLPDGSGLSLIPEARLRWGDACQIMVLSSTGHEQDILSAIRHGANGYVQKSARSSDYADEIRMLLNGESPLSPGVARKILQQLRVDDSAPPLAPPAAKTDECVGMPSLSPRETQTLKALAGGLSYAEAAVKLGVQLETIKENVKRIYLKMRPPALLDGAVNKRMNITKAYQEALRRGLLDG